MVATNQRNVILLRAGEMIRKTVVLDDLAVEHPIR